MELRDKIIEVIRAEAEANWNLDINMMTGKEMHELGDAILDIPEIAGALRYRRALEEIANWGPDDWLNITDFARKAL